MLDTRFERPPGDVGHAATWPFPVCYEVVRQATPRRVVGGADGGLFDAFVLAGQALHAAGALGAITSCGFLAARQAELARRLPLPIATSSLMQLPLVERCLAHGRRAGVVTYDVAALRADHFRHVGADLATPVVGLPSDGSLRGLIERGEPYDRAALEAEVLDAVARLLAGHEEVGAVVLECTNLSPFAKAVVNAFDVPVYDVVTLGCWFYSGLIQSTYHLQRGEPDAV